MSTHRHTRAMMAIAMAFALAPGAQAVMVSDPVGDFLSTYVASGRPLGADLDVVSAEVTYLPARQQFRFSATMAGAIGSTAAIGAEAPLYVWGIDRGTGTERFVAGTPSIGDGVTFDAVLLMNAGTGALTVNLFNLGGPAVTLNGATQSSGAQIMATIDAALLPSRGLDFSAYSWNLWPRFGAGNNAQISDFAPNESGGANNAGNAVVTVPEPSGLALLALAGLAAAASRRRARRPH